VVIGCCALALAEAAPEHPLSGVKYPTVAEGLAMIVVGPILIRWSRARRHRLRILPDGLVMTHLTGSEYSRRTELAEVQAEGDRTALPRLRSGEKVRVRTLDVEGAVLILAERWGLEVER